MYLWLTLLLHKNQQWKQKLTKGGNYTQEPMDEIIVRQEPTLEVEASQGEKEVVTQEPIGDVVVTQEPIAKMEKFHNWEAVTPSIVRQCDKTPVLDEGWCSERIFLIPKLQKWK